MWTWERGDDGYVYVLSTGFQRDKGVILMRVRELLREAAPEALEKIAWQMPTYWQKENLIHFAAFKKHIGLYPGPEAIEVFAERLKGYKTSKGAIQLPLGAPLERTVTVSIASPPAGPALPAHPARARVPTVTIPSTETRRVDLFISSHSPLNREARIARIVH